MYWYWVNNIQYKDRCIAPKSERVWSGKGAEMGFPTDWLTGYAPEKGRRPFPLPQTRVNGYAAEKDCDHFPIERVWAGKRASPSTRLRGERLCIGKKSSQQSICPVVHPFYRWTDIKSWHFHALLGPWRPLGKWTGMGRITHYEEHEKTPSINDYRSHDGECITERLSLIKSAIRGENLFSWRKNIGCFHRLRLSSTDGSFFHFFRWRPKNGVEERKKRKNIWQFWG